MNSADVFSDLDRRTFFKNTSIASLMAMMGGVEITAQEAKKVADGTVPPPKADPNYKEKPPGPPVKFGVIGLGAQGRDVLANLAKLPNGPVVAICDSYKSSKTTENYKEVLENPEVQAVVIATPTHLHKEIALAAIQAGKHVYLEAPMAHTIDDAKSIAKAAQGSSKVFQVGLQFRENPQHRHVFKFFRTGACGKTAMARSQFNKKNSWRRASPNPEREKALNWRLYKETSLGLVGEIGIHHVDTVAWYLDALPLSVTGFGGILQWQDDRETPDTVQSLFEFPNGMRMNFSSTLANSFEGEHQVFFGSDAAVLIRDNRAWMFKEVDAPLLGWEVYARKDEFLTDSGIALVANATKILAQGKKPAEAASDSDQPIRYALERFIEHINDNTKPDANWKAGLTSAVIAIKANEAILTGTKIQFDKAWFEI